MTAGTMGGRLGAGNDPGTRTGDELQGFLPEMKALQDTTTIVLLFIALLILGITITVFSTYRSVRKYLRMKLDELY